MPNDSTFSPPPLAPLRTMSEEELGSVYNWLDLQQISEWPHRMLLAELTALRAEVARLAALVPPVVQEVLDERARQDAQWGGPSMPNK